eukprot:GEMP01065698.1.p2 GENE.GEMP01065698.1~~GEMP01065698.1.p2  ORF type:complete len:101 (+),score=9.36 GEMP01065698.1:476-778(+)
MFIAPKQKSARAANGSLKCARDNLVCLPIELYCVHPDARKWCLMGLYANEGRKIGPVGATHIETKIECQRTTRSLCFCVSKSHQQVDFRKTLQQMLELVF